MNRRQFLGALGVGAAAAGGHALGFVPGVAAVGNGIQPATRRPWPRHWAWMRGSTTPLDAWRRKLASMRASGIEAVLISGDAAFYRTVVPAAAQEGIQIHAWMFTMMRAENVDAHPDWYAVSRSGVSTAVKPPYVDYYKFMCPSREEVRRYLVGVMREIAQVDGLGGVHLDYVRYPDVILPVALWPKYNLIQDKEYPDFDFCYCAVCRERFRNRSGVDPRDLADPPANRAWLQYRYDTITEVVGLIADEVHARGQRLSAAVFPTPAIARTLVRQDWTRWKLDAVFPMTYNGFYKEDVAWIERATREGVQALGGRIPLFSGLYVPDLPPADLARAATRAYAGGAHGVSVFEANALSADHWIALAPVLEKRSRLMRLTGVAAAAVGCVLTTTPAMPAAVQSAPSAPGFEALPFAPRHMLCYHAPSRLLVDGKLDEPAWRAAPWSEPFIDITGDQRRPPRLQTRVKMLWDADFLYVGAELEEPDVWATMTERDSVIFHENDFELFIDPDGDTHNYYELEVNALKTAWDLLLLRPYRDEGLPINGWDIAGLEVGVDVRGTLNHPGDRDEGWTVEIAMPWNALAEAAPGHKAPVAGDQWRVNFSRVEWRLDVKNEAYVRRTDPATHRLLPEDNWVWSPQGVVAMHMPERWGVVQFSDRAPGAGPDRFIEDPNRLVEWALRRLYYRQHDFRSEHGRYSADLRDLRAAEIQVDGLDFQPVLQATDNLYEISAPGFGNVVVRIRQDGRVSRAAR